MEKKSWPSIPWITMNFLWCCKLSGHWEEKYWRLHLEIHLMNHTTNIRVWRVKVNEDEDITTSTSQEERVAQGFIATQEASFTNGVYNKLMPISKVSQIQLLLSILNKRIPFMEMCRILMHRGHWHWGSSKFHDNHKKKETNYLLVLVTRHMNECCMHLVVNKWRLEFNMDSICCWDKPYSSLRVEDTCTLKMEMDSNRGTP